MGIKKHRTHWLASFTALALALLGVTATALPAAAANGDPFPTGSGLVFVAQGPARGQPSTLYEAVQGAGAISFVKQGTAAIGYNAIGYREADHYLWGINDNGGLVRIGQGGVTQGFGQVGLPSSTFNYNQGTFGTGASADTLFVRLATSDRNLYAVDVVAKTTTRIQLSAAVPNISDIVYTGGYIWGVYGEGSQLYRIDPATGIVTVVAVTGLPKDPFGAQWVYGNGNIGISDNNTGTVYQLALVNPTSATPSIQIVSATKGPANTQNDGASYAGLPVDLGVVKAGPATYTAGAALTYTLTVHNYGPGNSSGYIVRDTLPTVLTNAATTTPGCSITTDAGRQLVVCAGGPLANGADATITITGQAPGLGATPACTDGAITNVADVTGNEADPNLANNTATSTACPAGTPIPSFTVAKTADVVTPASVVPGGTVTYTVTVTNTGPVAYTTANPASFVDSLGNLLDDATVDEASLTGGAVLAGSGIVWSGALPVGGTATVTYAVTVNDPDTGDHVLTNAVVPGGTGTCAAPDACSATTPVAEFTVSKAASVTQAAPGDTVTYTITVTNTGAVNFGGAITPETTQAQLSDSLAGVLPFATYNNDASNGGTLTGNAIDWALDLPIGQTVQLTYTVTVNAGATGTSALVNVVTPTGPGRCVSAADCTTDTPIGSYTVTKSVSATQASPGDTVTYTVAVTNTGAVPVTGATFTDDLSAVLDDATFDPASLTGGASFAAGIVSWTGDLAAGATTTVTYSVTVNTPDTGDHQLTNVVVPGGSGDCVGTCTTTTPVGEFAVAKTASVRTAAPGDVVTYTILVRNDGQLNYGGSTAPFTAPAVVLDPLTDVLPLATYNGDATGGGTLVGDTLTWNVDLPIGQSVTLTFTVTVKPTTVANPHIVNVVIAGSGGHCTEAGACTTDVAEPHFTVSKTVDPDTATAGTVLTYSVTVTNTADVEFTGVAPASFTDDLTRVLDDATYNGDATNGATVAGSSLSWSGPLAVGADIVITYSVTVNDPLTGDGAIVNTVTPADPGSCATPTGCTTTVTVTPVTPTPTPTPAPTVTPAPPAPSGDGGGPLPDTGSNIAAGIALGAAAIVGGLWLILFRRRRRA